ncbi:MAG TPA: amidohydrolase family protein [Acidimicrobiia bacterium]|nr:amidohydrolase family protein [Acidimicrobiia bacterium]
MSAQSVRVFGGGPIRTMDPRTPDPEIVVIEGDRIAAVGDAALRQRYPDSHLVDLAGRTLVPAFIDAHQHLSVAALHPRWRDTSTIRSRDELSDAIRRQAADEADAPWVRLCGWDEQRTGWLPTRHDLDAAGVERPVVVAHYSLHQCIASTAALDELGIGRTSTDPSGGEIGREDDRSPSGLLVERAWSDAHARSMAAYADADRWPEHLAAHGRGLWRHGITAVHDAACSPEAEAVYRSMARARLLPVSVVGLPHPAALLRNDHVDRLDGPPTGDGDDRFRVGPMKLFADGGVAIALDASIGGESLRYGILMDDLHECGSAAIDAGFRIAVHAIGNAGVDAALALFRSARARLGDSDHRFRLEHAGVTGSAHWSAMAALGAVAVVQPGFVEHVGIQSGGVEFDHHRWLAFGGMAEAGVLLAGSSDEPCAPVSPMWCAAKGHSRTTSTGVQLAPEQSVPLDAWLHAYTAGAAYAGGQEDERGTLTPGKVADLVVLDLAGPVAAVVETWRAGERVFRAEGT